MNSALLTCVFNRVEPLADKTPENFEIRRLPGFTNDNYHLKSEDQDWVLRLPRAQTNAHIDREAEADNQQRAADLGIAPIPAWRDQEGRSLTATIRPGTPITGEDLRDPKRRLDIIEPISRLHLSGARFCGRLEPGPLIEHYQQLLPPARRNKFAARVDAARLLWPQVQDRDPDYVPVDQPDPVVPAQQVFQYRVGV